MRHSAVTTDDNSLPFTDIKIDGCANTTLGFEFLLDQPKVGARRYCNKVLVHECIGIPEPNPMDLDRLEFFATDDPCYKSFNLFKSSEEVGEVDPTITIQTNDDDLVVGALINFDKSETCCQPIRMSYQLFGYSDEIDRLLLSRGNLYITPCQCPED